MRPFGVPARENETRAVIALLPTYFPMEEGGRHLTSDAGEVRTTLPQKRITDAGRAAETMTSASERTEHTTNIVSPPLPPPPPAAMATAAPSFS